MKENKINYIDNKKFYDAMVEYKEKIYGAKYLGKPKPQVTNYIADCFMKIAENLARSPKYSKYTWKDMMVSDAILNMLQYCDRFDETRKEKNPFAYFSRVAIFSFWRRIELEKDQLYTKYKLAQHLGLDNEELGQLEDNGADQVQENQLYDNLHEFIAKHEAKKSEKQKKTVKKPKVVEEVVDPNKGLRKFMNNGEVNVQGEVR